MRTSRTPVSAYSTVKAAEGKAAREAEEKRRGKTARPRVDRATVPQTAQVIFGNSWNFRALVILVTHGVGWRAPEWFADIAACRCAGRAQRPCGRRARTIVAEGAWIAKPARQDGRADWQACCAGKEQARGAPASIAKILERKPTAAGERLHDRQMIATTSAGSIRLHNQVVDRPSGEERPTPAPVGGSVLPDARL